MPRRILIAEDDRMSREMLSMFATTHGYEIVAVADGVELLTTAANEEFDVIITDLMMVDLDGAAATEILKLNGSTAPVIAITALTPQETSLIQDKFTKIFYKPCNFDELFEFIATMLQKSVMSLDHADMHQMCRQYT